jgi:hypothetical protein
MNDLFNAYFYLKKCRSTTETILPSNHPKVAATLNNLTGKDFKRGDSKKALEEF